MSDIKLGKLPPVIDKRTITLRSVLKELPPPPDSYNIDEVLGVEDNRVFLNDQYGDCVKAARAHQTMRFEKFEQGTIPYISDEEVKVEYFAETGGQDNGLVLLFSLKDWRNDGWIVNGNKYNIYAFASVDWKDHTEVKHCIHKLGGINFGMMVYQTDIDQFHTNQIWSLTGNDGELKGGHGVYLYAYDQDGITCMTWGKRQKMTWDFWDKRVDEAYAIVDNKDYWVENSQVDVEELDAKLHEITNSTTDEPVLPGCLVTLILSPILILRRLINGNR
jgi:hypothetical protein